MVSASRNEDDVNTLGKVITAGRNEDDGFFLLKEITDAQNDAVAESPRSSAMQARRPLRGVLCSSVKALIALIARVNIFDECFKSTKPGGSNYGTSTCCKSKFAVLTRYNTLPHVTTLTHCYANISTTSLPPPGAKVLSQRRLHKQPIPLHLHDRERLLAPTYVCRCQRHGRPHRHAPASGLGYELVDEEFCLPPYLCEVCLKVSFKVEGKYPRGEQQKEPEKPPKGWQGSGDEYGLAAMNIRLAEMNID